MLTVADAAASGCRYKTDVESGALVVVVGEYSIIDCLEQFLQYIYYMLVTLTVLSSFQGYSKC